MRRAWGAGLRGFTLGILVLCFLGSRAGAEEETLGEREIKNRLRALKSASNRWFATRQRFPSKCPLCRGRGQIVQYVGGRAVRRTCNQCEGNRYWVSDKHFRKCYYDTRSDAYQAMEGVKDHLGRVYAQARAGTPWPRRFRRVRLQRVEMIDASHGVAWHLLDADRAGTETRWVFVKKGRRETWCLWHERADGAWPRARVPSRGAKPDAARSDWSALSPEAHKAARTAAASAYLSWRSFELLRRGDALRVRLTPIDPEALEIAEQVVAANAARVAAALFRADAGWARVRLDWEVTWKDAYDRVVSLPLWISRLERSAFEANPWAEMPPDAQARLLGWEQPDHQGFRRWPPPKANKPAPSPPPPPPEAPPQTGPQPHEPPAQPAPPAPSETYEPPPPFEPPELSKRVRKKADELVQEMRAIYQRAATAYDEGQVARRSGAHDLFQEKLAEVRALLGTIQDLWNEELNALMPGKGVEQREMCAEHYYGSFLDEIYELKAIVRKLARG